MLAKAFSLKAQDAAQNVKGKEILQENKTLRGRVLYIATSVCSQGYVSRQLLCLTLIYTR